MTVERLCEKVGMSRQNFYKDRRQRQRQHIDEDFVVAAVKAERREQPRLGVRKLLKVLRPTFIDNGIKVGRDRFFGVLRYHGLLLEPLPRNPRTTYSHHALPVFSNLIKDTEPRRPNEIWVADITYLRTEEGFVYLALLMDRFSRKIVGYHCGDTLEAIGCVRALRRALNELPEGCSPIHHSDRGCQYCCHEYVHHLQSNSMPVSMTEERHCYENAHAERLNGILKQEYCLGHTFRSRAQASRAVDQAVWLYNTRRPHCSLNYATPETVHKAAA